SVSYAKLLVLDAERRPARAWTGRRGAGRERCGGCRAGPTRIAARALGGRGWPGGQPTVRSGGRPGRQAWRAGRGWPGGRARPAARRPGPDAAPGPDGPARLLVPADPVRPAHLRGRALVRSSRRAGLDRWLH